jgi:hypothetical protein
MVIRQLADLSDVKGSPDSYRDLRTAKIVEWCPDFIGSNISDSESDDDSSSLSSITNVGFSLTGKVPHCECGEQGSSPESQPKE